VERSRLEAEHRTAAASFQIHARSEGVGLQLKGRAGGGIQQPHGSCRGAAGRRHRQPLQLGRGAFPRAMVRWF